MKITILPVTLHPETQIFLPSTSSKNPSTSICTIKTVNAETAFFNGIDGRLIQTVMRELKQL
ncbi:hypothetical protein CWS01_12120 [Niallia nealsonii]|uniref:Uncharacterized protein n=1 Tax=Niallia nealsonii TaxID=115979 RepID=A0A2N0Z1Q5_9BACI|nr:hypothetical protein CWS01_12120 [Niallia nealsonii]